MRVKSASNSLLRKRAARRSAEVPVVAAILVESYLKLIKITPETWEIFVASYQNKMFFLKKEKHPVVFF